MKQLEGKEVILGGGLAGYFLAANLIKAGRKVLLIHNPTQTGASGVAAGLVNPITGRQSVLTWRALEFLDALDEFLIDPLFEPLNKFYHRMPVYRPFPDIFSGNEWAAKSAWSDYQRISQVEFNPWRPDLVKNPFGGVSHLRSGWLDIPPFLSTLSLLLQKTGNFSERKAHLNYDSVSPETNEIVLNGEQIPYQNLIFCEGIQAVNNPWFRIHLIPLKGQLLTLSSEDHPDRIVSAGVFMIPLANGQYRMGSTYERDFTHEAPDETGKMNLLQEVGRWWIPPIHQITRHDSGIRPTTLDRMPILGRQVTYPNLWVFNGLGAKGVLQGPALAKLMTQAILQNSDALFWKEIQTSRKKAIL
jgi:glycine/D-amino acid oxidase-like deaminating enzyme